MSYENKDKVKRETKEILSEDFEQVSNGLWRRKIKVNATEFLPPEKKQSLFKKFLKYIWKK